ncbi:DGQHR domain-containing protein [Cylindrospermum stagnale PCC 7417]|uniref:DGQHR domain-containing protein n=1 Tax=Cylindrospermum stagnale PCC 7417 TaxID=56107 RepID=K9WV37_9NOST|nr:DNA sulfur modification protein DndB [Cylindrospermum stagnale]AFZ23641.1 DGQHR domain-containing protein [Cylindrospermum stagnale PCC 7417]
MSQPSEENNNDITPEMQAKFSAFMEPFFSKYHRERCYPGLKLTQGNRTMLQINVPARDFSGLLQAKPSIGNDPDSGKNRPVITDHAEGIKQYIIERAKKGKPWIVGTLTANVPSQEITFLEFGRNVGLVIIRRDVKLDITDGQHRKRAIHELIESADSDLISDDDFPITLVLEGDFQQCQADFRDMAQTRPLDKSLLLSFGEFSGRVGISKELVKRVSLFKDKTEKIKANPSTKNKLIYTMNYIAKFVSSVFSNDALNQLKELDVKSSSDALVNCLNQFFSECSNTEYIAAIHFDELTEADIASFKEDCLLGVSVGLEVLGKLLYCAYNRHDNSFDQEKVSQLASLDWSRENEVWRDSIVRIEPKPKNPGKLYKIYSGTGAINDAVKIVKVKLGWP